MARKMRLIPYVVLAAGVLAGGLWFVNSTVENRNAETVSTLNIGGPFALTDQNGTARTDRDFRGKYLLVFFGYTYCPDVCPTTLAVMKAALEMMGSRGVQIVPLFITVDPKRDTPEKLKSYLSSFGPRFIGLTGDDKSIGAVAKEYRVYFQAHAADNGGDYAVDHSGIIYLMDPNGRFVANYSLGNSPDSMARDLLTRIR
jgi:protein SCO1